MVKSQISLSGVQECHNISTGIKDLPFLLILFSSQAAYQNMKSLNNYSLSDCHIFFFLHKHFSVWHLLWNLKREKLIFSRKVFTKLKTRKSERGNTRDNTTNTNNLFSIISVQYLWPFKQHTKCERKIER